MARVHDVVGSVNKRHGANTATIGKRVMPHMPRLPSGVFAFDLSSGGGIPRNRLFLLHGEESSGKTNLALRLIVQHQRLYPDQVCVFEDIEGTTAQDVWENGVDSFPARMGVDIDKLVMVAPDHAEQAADVALDFVRTEDCGLLVIDSIAALVTRQEQEIPSDKAVVAASAKPVSRLVKNVTSELLRAAKSPTVKPLPTIIWINQDREKIGVSFGDSTVLPGGKGQLFMASLRAQTRGKDVHAEDQDAKKDMPVLKRTRGTIHKWKCPIFHRSFEYFMAMLPHDGLAPGECVDEWGQVKFYLLEHNLLRAKRKGGPYTYDGEEFRTQDAVWEYLQQPDKIAALESRLLQTKINDKMNSGDAPKVAKGGS